MSILPLAACGGGGGGGGGGGSTPPAPAAEFIESPTGVFIALDDRATTLDQSSATTNLTVTGKGGNDVIQTGSGADTIDGGGGNDKIRSGEGVDNVNGGSGNDAIVLVGTTGPSDYTSSDITSAGNGYNLSDLITLADLNGRAVSEVVAGETIDGGTGTNTLFIYGTVDLTGVTVSNVTILEVHSDVTLSPEQIAQFTTVSGDGSSVINIQIPAGSTDSYILDLRLIDTSDIGAINVDGDITVVIDGESDVAGINAITTTAGSELTLKIDGTGSVNLGTLGSTFPNIDTLEISDTVTVEINSANDITDLGLTEITGSGEINSGGSAAVDAALDVITVDPAINTLPHVVGESGVTTENSPITVDVLANDSDSDNDTLTLSSTTVQSGNGSVSIIDGKILFDPGTDFDYLSAGQSQDVAVTYFVSDGKNSVEGTLTITVNGEIEIVDFTDGSKLTSLSLSSNAITRGDDGVELSFAVDGGPVKITIEVTDTFGSDHLFSVTGTSGTLLLPMDGTEKQKSSTSPVDIAEYNITSIYIEDADGQITYLTSANFDEYGFSTEITVNSGSSGSPDTSAPELSNFDLSLSAITLGDDEAPQLLSVTKGSNSSEIDGMMVKFIDEDGVLHSNYIDASSGTFSLYFDPLTSPSGTYTLYSVDVFGTEGNSNSYSASDIEGLFGISETSFTLANPQLVDLGSTAGTPYSYMNASTYNPSGDTLVDGILSGSQISTPGGGDPLVITYSFVSPDDAFFIPGYSDTEFELTNNIKGLTGEEQKAVRDLLDNISDDVNIIFVEVADDGATSAGQMRFAWTNGGTEDVEGTSAWAYYPGNYPQASDVWLISGNLDSEDASDNSDSIFENIVLHEIGHALGLKHPFDAEGAFNVLADSHDGNDYTAMAYEMLAAGNGSYDDYGLPVDLMSLDILALQYVYGANTDRSIGDNVYSFLPEEWNYMTVWDAGGTDTFDLKIFNDDLTIDLTPGAWSDVGLVIDINTGTSNIRYDTLQIAEDTIIENVIAGSGDDTITGNDYNNVIDGGAGTDTLSGGLGDDTFLFDNTSDFELDLINGGNGSDTLRLDGTMAAIDLSSIQVTNIEIIESSNTNPLDLTLSTADLLNATDNNDILIIAGGTGDSVTSIGQGWAQGADQDISGEIYNTYIDGGATLLIDEDITQDIS